MLIDCVTFCPAADAVVEVSGRQRRQRQKGPGSKNSCSRKVLQSREALPIPEGVVVLVSVLRRWAAVAFSHQTSLTPMMARYAQGFPARLSRGPARTAPRAV